MMLAALKQMNLSNVSALTLKKKLILKVVHSIFDVNVSAAVDPEVVLKLAPQKHKLPKIEACLVASLS